MHTKISLFIFLHSFFPIESYDGGGASFVDNSFTPDKLIFVRIALFIYYYYFTRQGAISGAFCTQLLVHIVLMDEKTFERGNTFCWGWRIDCTR